MRLALAATLILAASPAWAQIDPVSGAATVEFLRSSGPWGLVVVASMVIGLLWRQVQALSVQNGQLRDRRGDEADARAERFAKIAEGAATSAASSARALEGVEDDLRALADVVKVQSSGIDSLMREQTANTARLEANGRGITRLLGGRDP